MNNTNDPIHLPDAADLKPPEPPDATATLFTWAAVTASALFVFNLYYYLLLADRLSRATTPLALLLVLLPEGVARGAFLGVAQWYVLRRIVKSDYRWIVASIVGTQGFRPFVDLGAENDQILIDHSWSGHVVQKFTDVQA